MSFSAARQKGNLVLSIGIAVVALIGLASIGFMVLSRQPRQVATSSVAPLELTTYTNQVGLSFQYPKQWVRVNTSADQEIAYADSADQQKLTTSVVLGIHEQQFTPPQFQDAAEVSDLQNRLQTTLTGSDFQQSVMQSVGCTTLRSSTATNPMPKHTFSDNGYAAAGAEFTLKCTSADPSHEITVRGFNLVGRDGTLYDYEIHADSSLYAQQKAVYEKMLYSLRLD